MEAPTVNLGDMEMLLMDTTMLNQPNWLRLILGLRGVVKMMLTLIFLTIPIEQVITEQVINYGTILEVFKY